MTNNASLRLGGLFAGVGGIELGFQQAGFDPVFANEIDEKASITYGKNHKHELVTQDINFLDAELVPEIDVLTGGFPCQAFSVAGYQKGFKDPRGNVFWEIIRLIQHREPEVVFLENVKNLGSHDSGKTLRIIREALLEALRGEDVVRGALEVFVKVQSIYNRQEEAARREEEEAARPAAAGAGHADDWESDSDGGNGDTSDEENEQKILLGKYKGTKLDEVPASYLHWLWTKRPITASPSLEQYIKENIPALKKEHPDGIWS
jgi:hypothetical protein